MVFFLADPMLFEIPDVSFSLGRLFWVLMLLLVAMPWRQVGLVSFHDI